MCFFQGSFKGPSRWQLLDSCFVWLHVVLVCITRCWLFNCFRFVFVAVFFEFRHVDMLLMTCALRLRCHGDVRLRAEGRLEESDRLKRAAMEQRSHSDLVDEKHLAEIARLEEANRDIERERRELEEDRQRAQDDYRNKDAEAKNTGKALEITRRCVWWHGRLIAFVLLAV